MCYSVSFDSIFVFGGRVLNNQDNDQLRNAAEIAAATAAATAGLVPVAKKVPEVEYSGLYSFHVASGKWTLLREDSLKAGVQDIEARIGHSMLLDSVSLWSGNKLLSKI